VAFLNNVGYFLNSLENNIQYRNFSRSLLLSLREISVAGQVVVLANGGSSAIASHFCTDLLKRHRIPALFPSDHSLLTCFANDYEYENSGVEFIDRFCRRGTIVILISSSGRSPNILKSAEYCKTRNIPTFALAGFGIESPLQRLNGDERTFQVDSDNYNFIELSHLAVLLNVVEEYGLFETFV